MCWPQIVRYWNEYMKVPDVLVNDREYGSTILSFRTIKRSNNGANSTSSEYPALAIPDASSRLLTRTSTVTEDAKSAVLVNNVGVLQEVWSHIHVEPMMKAMLQRQNDRAITFSGITNAFSKNKC